MKNQSRHDPIDSVPHDPNSMEFPFSRVPNDSIFRDPKPAELRSSHNPAGLMVNSPADYSKCQEILFNPEGSGMIAADDRNDFEFLKELHSVLENRERMTAYVRKFEDSPLHLLDSINPGDSDEVVFTKMLHEVRYYIRCVQNNLALTEIGRIDAESNMIKLRQVHKEICEPSVIKKAIQDMLHDPGKRGAQAVAGIPGKPGPKGPEGPKGQVGEKGVNIGPRGSKGFKGRRGPVGPKGQMGEKGEKGAGIAGSIGPRGPKGFKGGRGLVGPKGQMGEKGEKGAGIAGNFGPRGPKGFKGGRGPVGPKGQMGEKGEKGAGIPRNFGPRGIAIKGQKRDAANIDPRKLANWKQCSWRSATSTDSGKIKECSFNKLHQSMALKVSYKGNIRVYNSNRKCNRWYFKFSGSECSEPLPVDSVLYANLHSSMPNIHRPHFFEGLCENLPRGTVRVELWVGKCSGLTLVVLVESGMPGLLGMQGMPGSYGIPGAAEVLCSPGPSGPPGRRGDMGEKGRQGDAGIPGKPGSRGPRGHNGLTGERGGIGNMGEKDREGIPRKIGPRGYKGSKGETGSKGVNGTGIPGMTGPRGLKGE
ncbi:Collagen triple helix repeat-containing protein 1 [Stylophora pistillata]|uniref:Collagen triple helix repeat-containing protein 1 n=1 Tax=Stylophora pistillata TaxID=50429 RepID=A0A2B4RHQ7_STYPI|nr:Collagen triple helix repeat-containing protein 1 [Stylophora pistillata]